MTLKRLSCLHSLCELQYSMELSDKEWRLMARVLSKEVDPEELKEFEELLVNNFAAGIFPNQLSALWARE